MPNGVAPPGSSAGEADSSVRSPPCTAKMLTAAIPASTTYRYLPFGARRASNGRRPAGLLNGVLPSRVSLPSPWIRKREIEGTAVFTVNRYWPSCVISTQLGAVWLSANGEPPIDFRAPFFATRKAETVPLFGPSCAFETNSCEELVGR